MIGGAELCFIFPTATPYLMNKFRDRNQPMTQERLHVSPPRFEHLTDALGIGVAAPRLSWIVETPAQGWRQVPTPWKPMHADGAPVAATGRLESGESVLVAWPFAPLTARQRLHVRVRVWGEDGEPSPWSELAPVEAGLLNPTTGRRASSRRTGTRRSAAPSPRRCCAVNLPCAPVCIRARLYITAQGVYTAQLNGAASATMCWRRAGRATTTACATRPST
jgi:alpha-L-rhamnosidase